MPKIDKARRRDAQREKLVSRRPQGVSGSALKANRQQKRALEARYGRPR